MAKGLTAEEAVDREFCPDNDTMTTICFFGILRTGRGESTGKGVTKKSVTNSVVVRGNVLLVEGNHFNLILK